MPNAKFAGLLVGLTLSSAVLAQSPSPVATRGGFEVGGQVSDYDYEEPDFGVRIDGTQIAFVGAYTLRAGDDFFARFELRSAYGELYYKSTDTGSKDSVPNSILEGRALMGADLLPEEGVGVTPYFGIGYRYLFNDLRGFTSTGAIGYRRHSRYLYLPLGVTMRFRAGEKWVIAPTVEYDYFIRGEQETMLSDTGLGFVDVTNRQRKGYGYRASLMFERDNIAFGPWIHGWEIEDSDIVPIGGGEFGLEPKNETLEAGIEVKYRF